MDKIITIGLIVIMNFTIILIITVILSELYKIVKHLQKDVDNLYRYHDEVNKKFGKKDLQDYIEYRRKRYG